MIDDASIASATGLPSSFAAFGTMASIDEPLPLAVGYDRPMTRRAAVRAIALLGAFLFADLANAGAPAIAVASNFASTAAALAEEFERRRGYSVWIVSVLSGKLYAQIVNGAPYAMLLAADARRPELLEAAGLGIAGTRFTYAAGGLVVWSADPALRGADCVGVLSVLGAHKLAIANPATAPYGAAARQFLESAGLWDTVRSNLVFGENIAQTLQFVATRNARIGLVARSQLADDRLPAAGCEHAVPADTHEPIEQQAILLRHGAGDEVARAFLEFLRAPGALGIIRAHGYEAGP